MSTTKINITFVLPSLVAGGAERIMSYVSQHIDRELFNVTLLILGFKKDNAYTIHGINQVYLNKPRVLNATPKLIGYLKRNKPQIVVSSIVHLNTIIALVSIFFPKIKFVAREANVLSVLKKYNHNSRFYFPPLFVKIAYKIIDRIICQSKDMQYDMITNYGVSKQKTVLINNPITRNFKVKTNTTKTQNPLKFITIARLSKEKGHDRIIEILSKLTIPFSYTMIGDGIEKDAIFKLIKKHNLEEHITHIPFTREIENYLSDSDIFLQGSYVEGFPNALIESSLVGTPIIAIKAPGGLDEIIEEGINGYVVNTIEEYLDKIHSLYNEFLFVPEKVAFIVTSRFGKDKIIKQYESLFLSLVKR